MRLMIVGFMNIHLPSPYSPLVRAYFRQEIQKGVSKKTEAKPNHSPITVVYCCYIPISLVTNRLQVRPDNVGGLLCNYARTNFRRMVPARPIQLGSPMSRGLRPVV